MTMAAFLAAAETNEEVANWATQEAVDYESVRNLRASRSSRGHVLKTKKR